MSSTAATVSATVSAAAKPIMNSTTAKVIVPTAPTAAAYLTAAKTEFW
jgi:hypothetical protein